MMPTAPPIQAGGVYEAHLSVSDLDRSIEFYGRVLGFTLALRQPSRNLAFLWTAENRSSMLGLWAQPDTAKHFGHTAFRVPMPELMQAPSRLKALGVEPLDWNREPTDEPWVFAWVPAAFVYFPDPDGNNLELITVLDQPPQPDLGHLPLSQWEQAQPTAA